MNNRISKESHKDILLSIVFSIWKNPCTFEKLHDRVIHVLDSMKNSKDDDDVFYRLVDFLIRSKLVYKQNDRYQVTKKVAEEYLIPVQESIVKINLSKKPTSKKNVKSK
jgi:hypothetical protein